MSPLRPLAAPLVLIALLAGGCEGWPRYLYEGIEVDTGADQRLVAFENESLDNDAIQFAGEVEAGTEILLFGYAASCGYDTEADGPDWPDHPWDEDGDGIPDGTIQFNSGWFTGDVDWFGVSLVDEVVVSGSLTWDHRPPGASNAPYQPEDETGDWVAESDLDFVLFEVEGTARILINESAVSNDYPETIRSPSRVAAGSQLAVAVGCHHQVPTDYALALTAL
jgi:hypothetical protein